MALRMSGWALGASAICVAGGLALAPLAFAEPKPSETKDPPTDVSEAVVIAPPEKPDPTICRREKPTGSRISVKVCMKQSQWVAKSVNAPRFSDPQYADGDDDGFAPKMKAN